MLLTEETLKEELLGIVNNRITEEDVCIIEGIIRKQISAHKLNGSFTMDKMYLYIVGKEVEGIDFIKVFDKNIIIYEQLDTSYTRMRNLSTLEEWNTKFIYKVEFVEDVIKMTSLKIGDIITPNFKKPKKVTYAVTDGEDYVKVNLTHQDIKELDLQTLKDILAYTFNKKVKKSVKPKNLAFILIAFK